MATGQGGALQSPASVTGCSFIGNNAFLGGAVRTSSSVSTCMFDANTATKGGAVALSGSTGALLACDFTNNVADGFGGAVFVEDTTAASIWNCTFAGNQGGTGGAVYGLDAVFTIAFDGGFERYVSSVALLEFLRASSR